VLAYVSDFVIGATVVAVGTSVPELATWLTEDADADGDKSYRCAD
jgi:hypothetical protein